MLAALPAAALLIGSIQGFSGSGSGPLVARLFLLFDVDPMTMAASAQMVILPIGVSGMVVFTVLGELHWGLAGALMGVSTLCTIAGHVFVGRWVIKNNKVVFVMVLVCTLCVLTTLAIGQQVVREAVGAARGGAVGGGGLCGG
jgi:uncharacterized membrane protein YfcA